MKTAKEIVDQINTAETKDPYVIEGIIKVEGATEIDELGRDEHRWYILGTTVYKIGEEFFGVNGVVGVKSQMMSFDDCEIAYTAFEMEAVPSVTYRVKQ